MKVPLQLRTCAVGFKDTRARRWQGFSASEQPTCFVICVRFICPQNNFTAFLQLLPVLVLILISVFTQMMATNPPYSLFYKPWVRHRGSLELPSFIFFFLCVYCYWVTPLYAGISGPWGWWCPGKRSTWASLITLTNGLKRNTRERRWTSWRRRSRATTSSTCRTAAGRRSSRVSQRSLRVFTSPHTGISGTAILNVLQIIYLSSYICPPAFISPCIFLESDQDNDNLWAPCTPYSIITPLSGGKCLLVAWQL